MNDKLQTTGSGKELYYSHDTRTITDETGATLTPQQADKVVTTQTYDCNMAFSTLRGFDYDFDAVEDYYNE